MKVVLVMSECSKQEINNHVVRRSRCLIALFKYYDHHHITITIITATTAALKQAFLLVVVASCTHEVCNEEY